MPEPLLYIDAEMLAESRDLHLLAQSIVEGYAHGIHRSPNVGSSQEFASYRSFLPGDPPQRIDWKVYGRTDEMFIREFEQETNLRGYLFMDASRSMDFGKDAGNKFEYGRLLCAVLAILLHRQQDAPALALFGKEDSIPTEDWWPPSTRRDHLEQLIHHLETRSADGPHDHLGGLPDLLGECHRGSLAAFITDGLVDCEELKDVLGQLRMRGTRIIVFHLMSREELEPEIQEEVILIDRETGAERPIDGALYATKYQENLQQVCNAIKDVCQDTETEYCFLPTDQPLDEALRRFLLLRAG